MTRWLKRLAPVTAALAMLAISGQAWAAPACRNTGSFERWLDDFKREAAAEGISRQAISAALDGVTFDPSVIKRDRGQGVFQQSFLQFAGRMTGDGRYQNGLKQLKNNAALFARIEKETGVPPPVVAPHCGVWKATTAHTRAPIFRSSARWRRWLTIAVGRPSFVSS